MNLLQLHHIIQILFTPPINIWLFGFIGLWFWKYKKVMIAIWLLGVTGLYLQYTPLFAVGITKTIYPALDRDYNKLDIQPQAIAVLGAGVTVEVGDFGEFEGYPAGVSLINIKAAAKVALENPTLPIILSGGVTDDGISEASAMQGYLRDNYSLLNQTILESQSLNTNQNARFTALKLNEIGIRRVILVTQASHMWRSAALFSKYGIIPICYPAWDDYSINNLKWWQKLVPNHAAAVETQKILHEYIGYFVYVVL